MKQASSLRRSLVPLKSRQRREWEARIAAQAEHPVALQRSQRAGVYGGTTTGPRAKTKPQRNRRLLDLARNAPCLLLVPACCNHRIDSTVAAHSNWPEHGKAGARKADDHYSVWSCFACHSWLDQGTAPAAQKRAVFDAGMQRQLLAWAQIADDSQRPDADRRAARWALERHRGAT